MDEQSDGGAVQSRPSYKMIRWFENTTRGASVYRDDLYASRIFIFQCI